MGFSGGSAGKESAHNAGDLGSIPGLGISPREGKSNPLQYSGLENSMDCIVHRLTKSRTGLSKWLSLSHFTSEFCSSRSRRHFQLENCNLVPPHSDYYDTVSLFFHFPFPTPLLYMKQLVCVHKHIAFFFWLNGQWYVLTNIKCRWDGEKNQFCENIPFSPLVACSSALIFIFH